MGFTMPRKVPTGQNVGRTAFGGVGEKMPLSRIWPRPKQNTHAKQGMSSKAVRDWYKKQVDKININLPSTKNNAKAICDQRASLKLKARNKMADQVKRKQLDKTDPIDNFDYYLKKYRAQGYAGNKLWKRIMQGGRTSNQNVNKQYGL